MTHPDDLDPPQYVRDEANAWHAAHYPPVPSPVPAGRVPYYQDEAVTLYHGDCREITEWLAADVLVTDPPYGMGLRSGWDGHQGDLRITGDEDLAARDDALEMWWGQKVRAMVFARWSEPPRGGARARLTWDKGEHVGMGDLSFPWKPNTEDVHIWGTGYVTARRASSVLRHYAVAGTAHGAHKGRLHPTEKPVSLMLELVAACDPGWLIADPFAGSGTTLVAAKRLGRRAVGVEIEERYCEVAARRLSQGVLTFGDAS